ncbi:hypothetical protein HPB47_013680 [Ixodes persulcatus]|uniref:Uncharacterized protein n=1 Tax=Ixodes persulcatus TaxID=34615 RepID=A0AC60R0N7_IXOPE|nr:hypothetical protein HPB47_013680 [Ixodes persulcatus]
MARNVDDRAGEQYKERAIGDALTDLPAGCVPGRYITAATWCIKGHNPPDSARQYMRVVKRNFSLLKRAVVPFVYGAWLSANSGGHHNSCSNIVDQAALDKLDAGFEKLQNPKDCKSLLKKCLTKDVFKKLKTRKTAIGATLLDIIQSGVDSLDSGVACAPQMPNRRGYSPTCSTRLSKTSTAASRRPTSTRPRIRRPEHPG